MLEKLRVKGFRAIGELEVRFSRLTVLVGPNASGKTSILEAINLLRQLRPPELYEARRGYNIVEIEAQLELERPRSLDISSKLKTLVAKMESKKMQDAATLLRNVVRGGRLAFMVKATMTPGSGPVNIIDVKAEETAGRAQVTMEITSTSTGYGDVRDALSEFLSSLILFVGEDRRVEDILNLDMEAGKRLYIYYPRPQVYERLVKWIRGVSRYTDMRVVPEVGGIVDKRVSLVVELYDGLAGEWVRVEHAAGGLRRALPIFLALASAEEGVVVIDDVDLGLHPAAQLQLAEAIVDTVKRGVQVILSTHSSTMLLALLNAAMEKGVGKHASLLLVCRDRRDVRVYETPLTLKGELPRDMVECLEEFGATGVFGEEGKLALKLASRTSWKQEVHG